ncbi:uncharacterized protein SCHCODRAFT_01094335, partial [Schizophyllum commune H4-8]|uniref:uncharacterized protein n=1 Tax=Schizophyllum commune (strain H4-8 / FGSC 9210) TaxID=578458 RepID=UPI00215F739C
MTDKDDEDDEDESDSSEDDSDSNAVVNLNDDDPPLIPYGLTAPTVQSSIKSTDIPSWDGDKSTAIEYMATVYELANSGGYLNEAVGFWLWTKLERNSPVWKWYMTLSDALKRNMKRNARQFMSVVQSGYLGTKWIRNLATEFHFNSFREPKHRFETPSQFIYRHILASRALAFAQMNSRQEVKLILSAAPASWSIILVPSSIKSTDVLTNRVLEFEDELSTASRASSS